MEMIKKPISNIKVYGLQDSIKKSKYPMSVDINSLNSEITKTVTKLATSKKGEGNDNWLNGVLVQFDLTFSIKAWVEAERYHFFDFVSSQSTMHRISKMDIREQCNEYVSEATIKHLEELKQQYIDEPTDKNYLKLLYNTPTGFQLTAGMTTNYRQLKTIYSQRKTHRLPEWREFCKQLEELPCSEFITGNNVNKGEK